jgi:hypothetical protein
LSPSGLKYVQKDTLPDVTIFWGGETIQKQEQKQATVWNF